MLLSEGEKEASMDTAVEETCRALEDKYGALGHEAVHEPELEGPDRTYSFDFSILRRRRSAEPKFRCPCDVAKGILELPNRRCDIEHPARALPVERYLKRLSRADANETYQLVEAVDHYRVVFSLADFDPGFTDRVAILADMAIRAENIDEAKAEEARRRAEARLAEHLNDEETAAVQAALGLTADDVLLILADGNICDESNPDRATLSLANVSLLYRYRWLARALGWSLRQELEVGDRFRSVTD